MILFVINVFIVRFLNELMIIHFYVELLIFMLDILIFITLVHLFSCFLKRWSICGVNLIFLIFICVLEWNFIIFNLFVRNDFKKLFIALRVEF
jgi:hypothetical protein